MSDAGRPWVRFAAGAGLVVLVLIETQAIVGTLSSHARLRDRALRGARDATLASLPTLDRLAAADPVTLAEGARALGFAAEVEVFDSTGRFLAAGPQRAPVSHWLAASELATVVQQRAQAFGPLGSDGGRVIAYAFVPDAGRRPVPPGGGAAATGGRLVRFAVPVPDLVRDLAERRGLLLAQGLALVLLTAGLALLLFPGRPASAEIVPGALHAYEEAMDRLQARGAALDARHHQERQRMEDQLADREAMARAGELTTGIVHEVRNGLGTILGYARMVERVAPGGEAEEAAARIREECETLEVVVRRFVDFVRRETLDYTEFDVSRMLSRVVSRECRSRPGAEVEIRSAEVLGLFADEELLERALENLIRNARDAAGPEGQVWVDASSDGGTLVASVADDGPGIPVAVRESLRPFFTTKAGGFGLGLPIALKIVRLHGGEMTFHDRVPRGLRVVVRLPRERPPDRGVTNGNNQATP